MDLDEERIALFLDYENLAIGARDRLEGMRFDLRPVLDALAERGRVIARKAYADWSYFDEDRRMLTRSHVELIEIPQRMGASRKNSADIKISVDALEMAFERDYVTTFVICTGDSDFTPLVHKLRELNKRVIGVGIKESTSALLPPACDEFLYYEALEGVDVPAERRRRGRKGGGGRPASEDRPAEPEPEPVEDEEQPEVDGAPRREPAGDPGRPDRRRSRAERDGAGAGVDGEARAAAQGSDVQRGRLRVPRVRRAAAPPRRTQRDRAESRGRPRATPRSRCRRREGETEAFELLRDVVARSRRPGQRCSCPA